ncbi:MAG TPA: hypothetical protein VMH31_06820 [Methylomirabilota bacterium]|nr:hypothetical protein [Methylomirabilota bacterium]
MIKLEATFRCVCPALYCVRQLDAANWETALAEVRLMNCHNGEHDVFVIRNIVLTEYDEDGHLTDLDLVSQESRKAA